MLKNLIKRIFKDFQELKFLINLRTQIEAIFICFSKRGYALVGLYVLLMYGLSFIFNMIHSIFCLLVPIVSESKVHVFYEMLISFSNTIGESIVLAGCVFMVMQKLKEIGLIKNITEEEVYTLTLAISKADKLFMPEHVDDKSLYKSIT